MIRPFTRCILYYRLPFLKNNIALHCHKMITIFHINVDYFAYLLYNSRDLLFEESCMEEISFREVYDYFKTKLLWVLITIIVALVAGNIYTMFIKTPMYQSNTTIVLVSGEPTVNQSDIQLNKNLVGTYTEIIKSRKVVSKVIDNLQLSYSVSTLTNRINVSSVEDTALIRISINDDDGERAAIITDELAKVFMEEIKNYYNLENVAVVDKAEIATNPYNINVVKDNIIYFIVAVVVSCGFIFLVYYFDTTIKSSEVIEEKFGLTVLGIVPRESNKE